MTIRETIMDVVARRQAHVFLLDAVTGNSDAADQLVAAIEDYLAKYNATPTQFQWTKDADTILAKIDRARRALTRRIDK